MLNYTITVWAIQKPNPFDMQQNWQCAINKKSQQASGQRLHHLYWKYVKHLHAGSTECVCEMEMVQCYSISIYISLISMIFKQPQTLTS